MLKNIFSIILLVVFANFIVAPTVISLLDNTADVSLVFSLNEEEKKEKESEKDSKLKVFPMEHSENSIEELSKNFDQFFKERNFTHFLELHLPPPEFS